MKATIAPSRTSLPSSVCSPPFPLNNPRTLPSDDDDGTSIVIAHHHHQETERVQREEKPQPNPNTVCRCASKWEGYHDHHNLVALADHLDGWFDIDQALKVVHKYGRDAIISALDRWHKCKTRSAWRSEAAAIITYIRDAKAWKDIGREG